MSSPGKKHAFPSREEEERLFAGMPDTRNEIVERYHKMLYMNLKRFNEHPLRDDMIQEGAIALMRSVEAFEPGRGLRFLTYAAHRVRGAFLDFWYAQQGTVRIPAHILKLAALLSRGSDGADCRPEYLELAKTELARRTFSLDASWDVAELNASWDLEAPDDRDRHDAPALDTLRDTQRYVVEQLFYQHKTMAKVGSDLGLTVARVSQIKKEALAILRRRLEGVS